MVPENTRTRLTLPTYGSDVVFTTSASNGASTSQASVGVRSALRGKDLRQRMFHRGREAAGGDLEQFQGADAGAAAYRDHREERTAGDGLLQILDQHRLVDRLTAEIALHQRLVLGLLDDSFDQGAARFLDPVGVGRVRRRRRSACRRRSVYWVCDSSPIRPSQLVGTVGR